MTPPHPVESTVLGVPASNRFRILVADDLAQNRLILSQILTRVGYDVETVPHGADALRRVACQPRPDLIITDVEMPEMDGIAMARALRQWPESVGRIPIIAASGSPDPALRRDILLAGADAFLAKPVQVPELLETIARLLRPPAVPRADQPASPSSPNRLPADART